MAQPGPNPAADPASTSRSGPPRQPHPHPHPHPQPHVDGDDRYCRIERDDFLDDLHMGSAHLAVHSTWWRRLLVRAALQTTARWLYSKQQSGRCYAISKRLLVKTGPFVHLTEAATMQYVAAHTSIPVPRVHCAFVHGSQAYIVMERMPGERLGVALQRMPPNQAEALLAELRGMVAQLRALQQVSLPFTPSSTTNRTNKKTKTDIMDNPGSVASARGGSLYDSRILRPGEVRFGPFRTIQDFHVWLRRGAQPAADKPAAVEQEAWDGFKAMVARQDGPWPPPVFTHGDISAANVLVQDGRVSGIIDWEFAGWYPSYWEYTASWYTALMQPTWQNEILPKIVAPCSPEELKMEITRQRYWGEV